MCVHMCYRARDSKKKKKAARKCISAYVIAVSLVKQGNKNKQTPPSKFSKAVLISSSGLINKTAQLVTKPMRRLQTTDLPFP